LWLPEISSFRLIAQKLHISSSNFVLGKKISEKKTILTQHKIFLGENDATVGGSTSL